jgi:hypothetical protein
MDAWLQVRGSDALWYVFREMYGSVIICVSNRSTEFAYLLLDCTRLDGWSLMASEDCRVPGSTKALEHTVGPNSTMVVGVLTEACGGLLFDHTRVEVHQLSARAPARVSAGDDSVLVNATKTSDEVARFLQQRSISS